MPRSRARLERAFVAARIEVRDGSGIEPRTRQADGRECACECACESWGKGGKEGGREGEEEEARG